MITSRRFGRERLNQYIKINFGINVNDKNVGNYLNALVIRFKIRHAKKQRECKNTNVKYVDLVKGDYNNPVFIATDFSYIPIKSNVSRHAYLFIAINHKTKFIESWNLSLNNDIELVYNQFSSMNLDNMIIHSDHGNQYSFL